MVETIKTRCHIWFTDGNSLKFEFDRDEEFENNIVSRIEKGLTNHNMAFEVEGRLMLVPFANVRTVEFIPAPKVLPRGMIRGAQIVE